MFALRKGANKELADEPGLGSDLEDRLRSERAIACAACGAAITSPNQRIAVHGMHEHRFMNPAGVLFHIGCFAFAVGCTIIGPDSLEYPWFPGLAWRYAMCGSCGQHLGWHFRQRGKDEHEAFFGLILNRLRQPADNG
jgi:hypothetical protein